ncbi:holo-ACP synthase, partial [Streptococcus thermophilus]|uniref:holo-ACP synthase n=1 Tax=Streptococcus thermophilus TaxID=1308 RepID=UPI003AFF62F2
MIFGNGIDIVEIERIKNITEKNSRFIEKNFTDNEIKYFTNKKKSYESIAGYFAAKEAV